MTGLKVGIVGLPNVGKSTLFQAITKLKVNIANYPFCTIKPNVGIASVPDRRVKQLALIYNSSVRIYPVIELIDIAGLVSGASHGEGLGNAFLSQIRGVDMVCIVVRCFSDPQVIRINRTSDPVADIELVKLEFLLSDQQQLEKKICKLKLQIKKEHSNSCQQTLTELNVAQKLLNKIINQAPIDATSFSPATQVVIRSMRLLSLKPMLVLANVDESTPPGATMVAKLVKLKNYCLNQNLSLIQLSCLFELQWSLLGDDERRTLTSSHNASQLPALISRCYQQLQLATFYTAGVKEVRGWTFKTGATARECAGLIHSDFKQNFIRARVFNCRDLSGIRSIKQLQSKIIVQTKGKNYLMADGDVCHFLTNG